MWQSASVLVGQPLRKLSLGIERLQQKKFRNFANFIMFQQTIFLIRNLFNLNRLCLRADLKNSMKKISRKFKVVHPSIFYHVIFIWYRYHHLLINKKRYCIILVYTISSFFPYYTFIVFASDVSSAAISGLPSTFINSSASTPSGTAIVLLLSLDSFICGLRFSLL